MKTQQHSSRSHVSHTLAFHSLSHVTQLHFLLLSFLFTSRLPQPLSYHTLNARTTEVTVYPLHIFTFSCRLSLKSCSIIPTLCTSLVTTLHDPISLLLNVLLELVLVDGGWPYIHYTILSLAPRPKTFKFLFSDEHSRVRILMRAELICLGRVRAIKFA